MTNTFNFEDYNSRFGGIARLYGVKGLDNLLRSSVLVVGLGGVGSWAAESLARSGVGKITLVDLDDICITNINRQLPALNQTIGKLKIEVMKERILAINPQCEVVLIEDFFTEKTAENILNQSYDFVIDAIDSLKNKCLLASLCYGKKIPVVITGGAAGKVDPSQITLCDLGKSLNDSLLFRVRKKLRQDFNFPSAEKSTIHKRQKFKMMCVYSPENAIYPTSEGGTCHVPDSETNLKMDCSSGMGSATHITSIFGMMAAGHAINAISKKPN